MKRYIRSAKQPDIIPPSLQVKKVGKYLEKHIKSAFRGVNSANTYDVYCHLVYQLKEEFGGDPAEEADIMVVNINLTTYSGGLRFNVIEMTPKQRTLGFHFLKHSDLTDLKKTEQIVRMDVLADVQKWYQEYDIAFDWEELKREQQKDQLI